MNPSRTAAFLIAVLIVYLAWGGVYIYRTSFALDGVTMFSLWDDAMISMRYAENFRTGHGLVWNPGETPVQGYSNLGITLIMSVLHFAPLGPGKLPLLFQLFNLGVLVAGGFCVWRIARETVPAQPGVAYCSVLATALSAPIALWGLQGGDTALISLWLLTAFIGATREEVRNGNWPLGLWIWLALGMVIRLDAAIYIGMFFLYSLLLPGQAIRRFATGAVAHAAVLGGLVSFSFLYYGDPLPNTYYLKATGTPLILMLRYGSFQFVNSWTGLIPALAVALVVTYRLRKRPAVLLAAALFSVAVAYNIRVGGDWAAAYGLRFIVPVLPFVFVLASAGCWTLLERPLQRFVRDSRARALICGTSAVALLFLTNPLGAAREWFDWRDPTMYRSYNARNAAFGLYLKEHSDPSTRIAVHWAGVAPYISRRPAEDVLGKCDRHIARMKVDFFEPGHSKWDWRYTLEEQRPDIFFILSRELGEREDFRALYVHAQSPHGLHFYVRKDAVYKLTEPGLEFTDLDDDS